MNRPVIWSIAESGRAVVNANGVVTPLQVGTLTIQVLIDGTMWTASYTSYDWETFASGGSTFVTLAADLSVTNRNGVSDRPELIVSCGSSGYFFLWVRLPHIITQNGLIAYGFDGGQVLSATWRELSPEYRSLWHPGTNGSTKAFTAQIAASRQFGFAFGEFQGSSTATILRVTGMAPLVATLYTLCPSNALVAGAPRADDEVVMPLAERARLMATYEVARGVVRSTAVADGAAERAAARLRVMNGAQLLRAWPVWSGSTSETRAAKRVRKR